MAKPRPNEIDWIGIIVVIGLLMLPFVDNHNHKDDEKFPDCDVVELSDSWKLDDGQTRYKVECFVYYTEIEEDGTQDTD